MKKMMLLALCMAAIVGCASIFKGDSVPVLVYRALNLHNQETLKASVEAEVKDRKIAADSMKEAAKSGDDMLTAAKEVTQNSADPTAVSKLDKTVSAYMKGVAKANQQREAYAGGLANLREEIQYQEEHWVEIIQQMTDAKIKQEHQRTHDRTMHNLQRKLEAVGKELQTFDVALARGANAVLAAESLKQYAVMGTIAGKLDTFVYQVREANSAMNQAANALLATLHTDDARAEAGTEVAGS